MLPDSLGTKTIFKKRAKTEKPPVNSPSQFHSLCFCDRLQVQNVNIRSYRFCTPKMQKSQIPRRTKMLHLTIILTTTINNKNNNKKHQTIAPPTSLPRTRRSLLVTPWPGAATRGRTAALRRGQGPRSESGADPQPHSTIFFRAALRSSAISYIDCGAGPVRSGVNCGARPGPKWTTFTTRPARGESERGNGGCDQKASGKCRYPKMSLRR